MEDWKTVTQVNLDSVFQSSMSEQTFKITHDKTKHCGGDGGLMDYFAKLVNSDEVYQDKWLLKAHKAVFAAEKSRLFGHNVSL